MRQWITDPDEIEWVEKALLSVYSEGRVRTGDLGGKSNTAEFTAAIIGSLG